MRQRHIPGRRDGVGGIRAQPEMMSPAGGIGMVAFAIDRRGCAAKREVTSEGLQGDAVEIANHAL